MSELHAKPGSTNPSLVPLVDEQHPWLGLLPFTERTRRFFFGRDAEIEEILGRIQENSLTVLFGQSGLGKTSLLGAGVLPRLAEKGCAPLLLRLDHDPAGPTPLEQTRAALRRAMPQAAWPEDVDQITLWELFHRQPLLVPADAACVPVLLFDQFEEIFTLGRQTTTQERHAEEWLEQMADLLQNRPPKALEDRFGENRRLARGYDFGRCPLRIVFSLREDYLSHLEAWKTRLPLLTQNRMALHLLNGPQALEAVLGPATLGASPLLSREVAGAIVRTVAKVPPETPLARIKAVPPLLSLLCEQLNVARLDGGAAEIDADMVRQRSGDILQRFYEDSFATFPQEHREVIRALIEDPPMVTEGGYRNSLVREDAEAQLARAGVPEPKAVFDALIHRRLITAEDHAGLQRLEITHDVLVPLLVRSRKERRDRVAKELAERKLAEEAAKARKRRLLIASMALLTLIAAAGAVFGWLATREATVQRNEALRQTSIAQAEAKRAEDSLSEAQRQAEKAKAEAARAEQARADSEKARSISERQLERSQLEEGRAWLERARTALGTGDHLKALMLAGRAAGFVGYGSREEDTPELKSKYPPLLGKPFKDAAAEKERLEEVKAVAEFVDAVSPTCLPIWSSPVQAHHQGPVTSVAFSPDGSRLASGSGDKTVKLWDAASGKEVATLQGHSDRVTSVAFSPDGSRLASGSDDKTVKLWDAASGKELATLQGHSSYVTSVAFSPDGSRLASGADDKTVKLWDAASGKELATLQGHSREVTSVAFSPDGSRLASGAWDKTVKLWDAASGKELAAPPSFPFDPSSASPDGKTQSVTDGALIRLVPADSALDLLALERKGYLELNGREIAWKCNDSLLSTQAFAPIHWRPDLLGKLAVAAPGGETFVLRLQLCSQGDQWRALLRVWEDAKKAGLAGNAPVRGEFCAQAAIALGGLALRNSPEVPAALWKEILDHSQKADWQEPRISLPLVRAIPALLVDLHAPNDLKQRLTTQLLGDAPSNWLEVVAAAAAEKRKELGLAETSQVAVSAFIRACSAAQPDNLPLLRLNRDTYAVNETGWIERVNRILSHREAIVDDFADAAYEAAKQPAMAAVAKDLLGRLEARFPDDEKALRMAGWCHINLGDHAAALRSFIASNNALKPEEKPGVALLQGLALAQWLTQNRDDAIATYKQLILTGRVAQYPEDWADPQTISEKDWPEAESKPLQALRQATLTKFPELKY